MQAESKSLIQLHVAVLLFAGTALFAKLLPHNALDITFYRIFIAALALLSLLLMRGQKLALEQMRDYAIATLLGVLVGLHWITYFEGMQRAGVSVAMLAFFTYPVIAVLLDAAYHRKMPDLADMLSGIMVFIGVLLIVPEINLANDVTMGILIGVVSGILFACRNIIHGVAFRRYSGSHAMLYQMTIAALMCLPFVSVSPAQMQTDTIAMYLLAGVVFTAMPHALFANALRHIRAKTVAMIACLQPVYGVVLATLILLERPDTQTIIGGAIIVCAALYETNKAR